MKDLQLKLLKNSIEHWRRLATGRHPDSEGPTGEHCALCVEYYNSGRGIGRQCDGCPIKEHTGEPSCGATPWSNAHHQFAQHGTKSKQFKAAAKKELAFLESLLPDDTEN